MLCILDLQIKQAFQVQGLTSSGSLHCFSLHGVEKGMRNLTKMLARVKHSMWGEEGGGNNTLPYYTLQKPEF